MAEEKAMTTGEFELAIFQETGKRLTFDREQMHVIWAFWNRAKLDPIICDPEAPFSLLEGTERHRRFARWAIANQEHIAKVTDRVWRETRRTREWLRSEIASCKSRLRTLETAPIALLEQRRRDVAMQHRIQAEGALVFEQLTPTQQKVLACLGTVPQAGPKTVAQIEEMSGTGAARALGILRRKGFARIERHAEPEGMAKYYSLSFLGDLALQAAGKPTPHDFKGITGEFLIIDEPIEPEQDDPAFKEQVQTWHERLSGKQEGAEGE